MFGLPILRSNCRLDSYVNDKLDELFVGMRKSAGHIMRGLSNCKALTHQRRKMAEQARPPHQPEANVHPQGKIVRNWSQVGPQPRGKAAPAVPRSANPPFPLDAPSSHDVHLYEAMNNGLTSRLAGSMPFRGSKD